MNKNPEADLERKRGLFFQIGLTIALAVALLVINFESAIPEKEETTTEISGLEVSHITPESDTATRIVPPEPAF